MVDYLLRDIPEQLHAKARLVAFKKKTTLRQLLLDSLEKTLGVKQPTETADEVAPIPAVNATANADNIVAILNKKTKGS